MVFTFQLAYALMMPFAGRGMDWLGTRLGYALAVAGVECGVDAAIRWRVRRCSSRWRALGWASANQPTFRRRIKTVADWFPRRERAFATGIFNSGSNIGAMVAPLMVPLMAAHFGWRASFLFTGGLDVIWLVLWLSFYRRPAEHKLLTHGRATSDSKPIMRTRADGTDSATRSC